MKNQYIYQNKDIVDAAKLVSEQLNMELSTVIEAYRLFFESIIDDISKTDFNKFTDSNNINMSYNIPSICKLYTSDRIIDVVNKKKFKKYESTSDKQSDTNAD